MLSLALGGASSWWRRGATVDCVKAIKMEILYDCGRLLLGLLLRVGS